ncbi:MAG: ECF transporter S component [Eubacteriales bacterium]|nr:ECF transporter S component [Eubacteriales bacterium]
MMNQNSRVTTVRFATVSIMCAISCILVLIITIPFPLFPAFRYDLADVPIMITTFAFGPVYGVAVTVIVSLIQAFILGQDGLMGFCMHVFATGAFVISSGLVYRHRKTKKNAVIALVIGTIVMTLMMCVLNLVLDPIFYGMPRKAVQALIPAILLFNFSKAGINSLITFLIYKRVSNLIHRAELKPTNSGKRK